MMDDTPNFLLLDRIYRIIRIFEAKLALHVFLCDLCVLCGQFFGYLLPCTANALLCNFTQHVCPAR